MDLCNKYSFFLIVRCLLVDNDINRRTQRNYIIDIIRSPGGGDFTLFELIPHNRSFFVVNS